MTAVLQREDLNQEEQEDVRENLQARFMTEETRNAKQPVELSALARDRAKLVILGDPGAGKTTLLRYLALLHAQAMRAGETQLTNMVTSSAVVSAHRQLC